MALSDNIFIVAGILAQVAAAAAEEVVNDSNRALLLANRGRGEDHRHGPRAKRTKFDYGRALACIMQDYLGPEPIFGDGGFQSVFRVSKARFMRIHDDIQATGNDFFFSQNLGCQISSYARMLLPLKVLAYGTSTTAFQDYFQISYPQANACCVNFDIAVCQIYTKEYLRQPATHSR